MIVVGIDPGKKGGYAIVYNGDIVLAAPMPMSGKDIDVRVLRDMIALHDRPALVAIEKVHSMPQQGVKSTFTFGMGYGRLTGMCEGAEWPLALVRPQEWKKIVLRGTEKDKDAAIAYVRQRHPQAALIPKGCRVPHDGVADAVCIAEWAWRHLNGQ